MRFPRLGPTGSEAVRRTVGRSGAALDADLPPEVERCPAPVRDRGRTGRFTENRQPGARS